MKKFDVTILISDTSKKAFSIVIHNVEAEDKEVAEILAISYARTITRFEVVNMEEIK